MPETFADVGDCVDAVLRRVGPRIVLAAPLGVGNPNPLVNELYRRALADPSLDLTILTALSLLKPRARSPLESRLVTPLTERVFGSYVEPEYARAMLADRLPANVHVVEFFLTLGQFLRSDQAQRGYLSSNYTHVVRDALARGVNVVAQLVGRRLQDGRTLLSLGSNPDVTADLLPLIATERRAGRDIVLVGEVNSQMPFMGGCAQVEAEQFDFLLDDARYDYDLYSPPNPPLSTVHHAIGMYASTLVRDGGTLQVGIGELAESLIYALLLRHQQNATWRSALGALGLQGPARALASAEGGDAPFATGLYAATEMFVDQLLELYRAGILRRKVYGSLPLERLLAAGEIEERFDERILESLAAAGVGPRLAAAQFHELQHYGVFREDVEFAAGRVRVAGGSWMEADLGRPESRALLAECLGRELRNGEVLHAGFFLGPRGFYAALRELPDRERARFGMRGVAFINQLYGPDQELRILQRRCARFINSTMMVTLLGAAVSDALADGRVVTGVGGQYNFVAMAHALPDARSILCVRSTRTQYGRTSSNLLWSYGHETIPRHLRDIVITEYGIADLRSRTDEEIIAALLNVADSRFQPQLLAQAQAAGKISRGYRIPDAFRNNLPQRLSETLGDYHRRGFFSEYPFGTDLSAEEAALVRALRVLDDRSGRRLGRARLALEALLYGRARDTHAAALRRMGLEQPRGAREWLQRRLVALALDASG